MFYHIVNCVNLIVCRSVLHYTNAFVYYFNTKPHEPPDLILMFKLNNNVIYIIM